MSDTAQFEISRPEGSRRAQTLDRQTLDGVRTTNERASSAGLSLSVGVERCLLGLCGALGVSALLLCARQPDQAWAWILAGAFLPTVLFALKRVPSIAAAPVAARSSLAKSLLIAGTLVLIPLLLRLAEGAGAIDTDGVRRIVGVVLGGALVVIGSYLPLQFEAIVVKLFEPALAQRIVRFASVGLMLAGGLYGAVWLLAPLPMANLWASTILAGAVLFVCARAALLARQRNR